MNERRLEKLGLIIVLNGMFMAAKIGDADMMSLDNVLKVLFLLCVLICGSVLFYFPEKLVGRKDEAKT